MCSFFLVKISFLLLVSFSGGTLALIEKQNETERVLSSRNIPITADRINDEFIVQLRSTSHKRTIEEQAQSLLSQHGISNRHLLHTYSDAINGFTIQGVSKRALLQLQRNKDVESISPNFRVNIAETQTNPTWNLDRIDQVTYPLSNTYSYDHGGKSVHVFILDTGIYINHDDIVGKASCGYSLFGDCTDNNGHGTHVAGIVGGTNFGVAKNVKLIAVKVLDDSGSGTVANVVAGINYVIEQKILSPITPMVINISFSTLYSAVLNEAVLKATEQNITVVVSAGNNRKHACNYSPASEKSAITVGATMLRNTTCYPFMNYDMFATFSNQGRCVDIFAPGTNITSAYIKCTKCAINKEGTSMASAHVAGVAAQYLEGYPDATPSQVWIAIKSLATLNIIYGLTLPGTPNVFLRTNL